uniref:Uncharacterized protein n=1 Tax=Rhizophora mucronata TaxID=61149 RepID=A0A2P2NVI2_RHIMU
MRINRSREGEKKEETRRRRKKNYTLKHGTEARIRNSILHFPP